MKMLQSLRFQLIRAHINENGEESSQILSTQDGNFGKMNVIYISIYLFTIILSRYTNSFPTHIIWSGEN